MLRLARLAMVIGVLVAARPARAFDWEGHLEVDAEGLASEDATKRQDAVTAISAYDISLSQPYLLKALADDNQQVRQAAAHALGAGGALAAVPLMIEWLADPDPKNRAVAADVLGAIGGAEATSALTRSLGDADPAVRQRAVRALGAIGRRGNVGVVIALIPRLEDDKPDIRRETIEQLEALGDKRAVIPLVAQFSNSSPDLRKAAVRAVGKLHDSSAVPALLRLINDPVEDVRKAAVGALGTIGAVDALDALTEQLATGSDAYRGAVAYALGQIAAQPGAGKAGDDAMRALVANLAQPTLRAVTTPALAAAGKAAVPALVAHLDGRIAGDPTIAVTLLTAAADPRATTALAAELERGRVAVPIVLKALGATGDPAALVPVLGALSSKDAAIRLAAIEALRPLLGSDARAGDVLIEHLADDDLEVRVLAAEDLGILKVGAASAKLTALTAAGNPARLRLAAIDALGEIGRADATTALIDVLRDGPTDLHRAAATALESIASTSDSTAALTPLVALARADRGPTRDHVVRALGGTLRAHSDATARKLLRELTDDVNLKVALAAIAGLAAAHDPHGQDDVALLRTLAAQAASDRRRAAAIALGDLHDVGSIDVLAGALAGKDDRVIGDAAWALGEILATAPNDSHVSAIVERWLFLGKHGGWAAAIDSTAALARVLWASDRPAREQLLVGPRRAALLGLTFHKSRLVRINVLHALASLTGSADAAKTIAQLLHDDPSVRVRIAAITALARVGVGASKELAATISNDLQIASTGDADTGVRDAAKTAITAKPEPIVARSEWRSFYVVDPGADDAIVRQEPYFVRGSDGLVWAAYTDARGELTTEHFPSGDAEVVAGNREADY